MKSTVEEAGDATAGSAAAVLAFLVWLPIAAAYGAVYIVYLILSVTVIIAVCMSYAIASTMIRSHRRKTTHSGALGT